MDKFNTTQIGLAKFNNKTLKENRNWKTKKLDWCFLWFSTLYT